MQRSLTITSFIRQSMLLLAALVSLQATVHASPVPVPAPPQVAAKSYLLIDFDSGEVLAEKESSNRFEPASITKLMTAYVVYRELGADRLALTDEVTISEKAWRMGGSRMYVEVGSKVTVDELLKGLVVQSGNDATVALAEHIAGSESAFVDIMNQYAGQLGMNDTEYRNSTGWPDKQHLTTAKDIATLATAIIHEFPGQYERYAEKVYTYNNIKQYNRNKLLWRDDSVDGMKTGHTDSAGYCLVSSAERSGMRLIAVVLGTKDEKARASVSQSLLNYGFRFFETHKLYAAGEILNHSRVWKGDVQNVALGLSEDLNVTIPRGSYKFLEAVMDVDANLQAPISKAEQLGVVRITLKQDELQRIPLVALNPVDRGNLFQIAKDYVLQMFN